MFAYFYFIFYFFNYLGILNLEKSDIIYQLIPLLWKSLTNLEEAAGRKKEVSGRKTSSCNNSSCSFLQKKLRQKEAVIILAYQNCLQYGYEYVLKCKPDFMVCLVNPKKYNYSWKIWRSSYKGGLVTNESILLIIFWPSESKNKSNWRGRGGAE